jgi:small conductance mechanosensitive channel
MSARRLLAVGFVLIVSIVTGRVSAQPADDAGVATPWEVSVDELTAELRPLRVEALTERAEFWMAAYQEAVSAGSQALVASGSGSPAHTEAVLRREQVAERFNVVLAALDAKGGDVSEYRSFIEATSALDLDVFDPAAVTGFLSEWIVSPDGGIAVGVGIVQFIVLLVLTFIIAGIISGAVGAAVNRLPNSSSMLKIFVVRLTKRIVILIGVVIAISFLGVNITPLIAAIGAAGLVIGLALQGTLSNFASGVLILVYRPYDVGDVINGGGVVGKVESMSLVSTRIATFDNQVMYVPNNSIWNGVITNITARDTRRVDLTFGIGYADDMAKAESIISEVVTSHPKVLKDPEPVIKVHELADSSVNFVVRPWSNGADYWDVYWDLTRKVKERFDAEGVGIPFPQRDLHIPGGIEVTVKNG